MRRNALAWGMVVGALFTGTALADDSLCRSVGNDWVWFSDHAALSIDYAVVGPTGRMYEIGTGVSFRGKPLGTKSKHEGAYVVTAYGIGAIHVRAADGGAPFTVCVSADKMELIPLCGEYSLDCSF